LAFTLLVVAAVAAFIILGGQLTRAMAATVTLSPGADIQAAIDSNPPGTTFLLNAGMYRLQSLNPLTGDSFIGQAGAATPLLDGATVLTNWVQQGNYWVSAGDPALSTPFGEASEYCQPATPGCVFPQDLFVNNQPLIHQLALPIVSGQWYFDYANDLVYIADDPTGQVVELSVAQQAFSSNAANVTIQHLVIEKYATPLLSGAIEPFGSGWTIASNTVRLNHGDGIKLKGDNEGVVGNSVHKNGQDGIEVGSGAGDLLQGNHISNNNYAECSYTIAGGIKVANTSNIQIVNNSSSNNDGAGIWADSSTSEAVVSGNTVTNNTQDGIRYEYSSYGTISNNVLNNNAQNSTTGACNPNTREIVAADSNNVGITGNAITSKCAGITLTQGTHRTVINVPVNLVVTGNTITYSGSTAIPRAIGGQDSQIPPPLFDSANNNYFDYNTYHFTPTTLQNLLNWEWGGIGAPFLKNWPQWQAAGQDIHGTVD
jgi:parallel beta-helix repeat protein